MDTGRKRNRPELRLSAQTVETTTIAETSAESRPTQVAGNIRAAATQNTTPRPEVTTDVDDQAVRAAQQRVGMRAPRTASEGTAASAAARSLTPTLSGGAERPRAADRPDQDRQAAASRARPYSRAGRRAAARQARADDQPVAPASAA